MGRRYTSCIARSTRAEEALEKMQNQFRLSAEGSDDDVAELVQEIHPRPAKKVYDFLNYLVQQQAWCGFEFKEHFFRYSDIEQLKMSVIRLQEDNIKETREQFTVNSRVFCLLEEHSNLK